jgi:hypothetical protein
MINMPEAFMADEFPDTQELSDLSRQDVKIKLGVVARRLASHEMLDEQLGDGLDVLAA